jgi:hypothetical protein
MQIRTNDVPCRVCGAGPGDRCVYTRHRVRKGQTMVSAHEKRRRDAIIAEKTANALLDQ